MSKRVHEKKKRTHFISLPPRRQKSDMFQKSDVLFRLHFSETSTTSPRAAKTVLLIDVLDEIHAQLSLFLKKLRSYFDQTKHRIGFFAISGHMMVSDIYFGATEFMSDDTIVDEILRYAFN